MDKSYSHRILYIYIKRPYAPTGATRIDDDDDIKQKSTLIVCSKILPTAVQCEGLTHLNHNVKCCAFLFVQLVVINLFSIYSFEHRFLRDKWKSG